MKLVFILVLLVVQVPEEALVLVVAPPRKTVAAPLSKTRAATTRNKQNMLNRNYSYSKESYADYGSMQSQWKLGQNLPL